MRDDLPDAALVQVTTTVASREAAGALARLALERRLAACAQVQPITSYYRWQGVVHEEAEWRLVCKTTPQASAALCELLRAHHGYELPQLVAQPLRASADYARWVHEEVAPPGFAGR